MHLYFLRQKYTNKIYLIHLVEKRLMNAKSRPGADWNAVQVLVADLKLRLKNLVQTQPPFRLNCTYEKSRSQSQILEINLMHCWHRKIEHQISYDGNVKISYLMQPSPPLQRNGKENGSIIKYKRETKILFSEDEKSLNSNGNFIKTKTVVMKLPVNCLKAEKQIL